MEGFSKLAEPLTNLTMKEVTYEWTNNHESAFQKLKEILTSVQVLAIPISGERFLIHNDASY